MSLTKKNNQWYFSMKAHIEMEHKIVHTLVTRTVKEPDLVYSEALVHGQEVVSSDTAYSFIKRNVAEFAGGVLWLTSLKRAKTAQERQYNTSVSSFRSRVKHGFHTSTQENTISLVRGCWCFFEGCKLQ